MRASEWREHVGKWVGANLKGLGVFNPFSIKVLAVHGDSVEILFHGSKEPLWVADDTIEFLEIDPSQSDDLIPRVS